MKPAFEIIGGKKFVIKFSAKGSNFSYASPAGHVVESTSPRTLCGLRHADWIELDIFQIDSYTCQRCKAKFDELKSQPDGEVKWAEKK